MKYNTYTMEEALEAILDYRGKTPQKSDSGIPTLSAKTVKSNYIDYNNCYYISESEYKRFMVRGFPKIGDVLLTTEAPLGMVARLDRNDVAIAQRLLTLRGKHDILDNDYLLYFLQSVQGQHLLKSHETGTTVTGIKQAVFRKLEISLPPIQTQRQIAIVMRSIDDKITVNAKINENLEQQAQAIYQSMFISKSQDSDRIGLLSELITVKYGKDHKKLNDGIYPVYGSGGIMRYVEKPLYDKESVLIPRKGSLNNVMYVDEPFWSVDTMFFTEMKLPNVAKYVFHFVKSKNLASLNAGSAVPSMTTDILNSMEVRIPSAERLAEFEGLVAPLYKAIKDNIRQSGQLSALRDTLLPKLMNGEIDVSKVRI